jgi:hypothetical protein
MSHFSVMTWWSFLCATATFNVLAWTTLAATLARHRAAMSAEAYVGCRAQLLLSAAFVFGCAFRSAHPVFDVPRLVLFNGWLSSVIVGRSVATVAELSFVTQLALMLRRYARTTGNHVIGNVSLVVIPLIAIAEICSWYSVLTTSNAGHVIEESLWGASAALMVIGMILMRLRCGGPRRRMLLGWSVVGAAYVAFMFLHDVPMYWSRWTNDESLGRTYLNLSQGLTDVAHRRIVSHDWRDWHSEVAWMTLYFSIAVWISILLAYATAREAWMRKRINA